MYVGKEEVRIAQIAIQTWDCDFMCVSHATKYRFWKELGLAQYRELHLDECLVCQKTG